MVARKKRDSQKLKPKESLALKSSKLSINFKLGDRVFNPKSPSKIGTIREKKISSGGYEFAYVLWDGTTCVIPEHYINLNKDIDF